MKTRPLLPLIVMALLWAPLAEAQTNGRQQRVPTVTRLVKQFTTLERELMAAAEKGDSATTDKLLADDFELRSGAMPGNPTPRTEWLKHSQGQAAAPIEQMAVHDYGNAAVVSFLWKSGPQRDIFVVDVWRRSGDTWKLSVRYASPAGARQFYIPGAATDAPRIQKKE